MVNYVVLVCLWKFLESSSKLAVSAFAYPVHPHSICTKKWFLHKNLQGVPYFGKPIKTSQSQVQALLSCSPLVSLSHTEEAPGSSQTAPESEMGEVFVDNPSREVRVPTSPLKAPKPTGGRCGKKTDKGHWGQR